MASVRFTAKSSNQASQMWLYFDTPTGSPGYQAAIEGDNAGVPDGIVLASTGSFYPVGGWNSLFLPNYPLTAGNVYHIVVGWNGSSTVDSTHYALWQNGTSPIPHIEPLSQLEDPNSRNLL